REARHTLPAAQAENSRLHLLSDARGRVEAETDHRIVERGVGRLLEPVPDGLRHDFRQHEVPQEHLHQQGNIAEQFDVSVSEPYQPGDWRGADYPNDRAD